MRAKKYVVHFIDVEYNVRCTLTYRSRVAAEQAADDLRRDGNVVTEITPPE